MDTDSKSKLRVEEENIKLLIKGLSNTNGLIRRSYAEKLGKIGKAALPELINALLNSKNVIQRRAAAKTLKLVEDPTALPHLITALTNDLDPVVQCSSAGAIAIFGEAAAYHLINVLENKENTEMQESQKSGAAGRLACDKSNVTQLGASPHPISAFFALLCGLKPIF